MSARYIAVDWGTSRLRAHLMDADGSVVASKSSDMGVQSVPPGGFPDAIKVLCAPWLSNHPAIALVMAGMVGSRNGWVEAPYVSTPCTAQDLARACLRLDLEGHPILIIPGVDTRWPESSSGVKGAYDVMRGEETQVLGLGLEHALVCLPGTHSKWIEISGGRIMRFATFITGELYSAMAASFIARLASEPEQQQPGADLGRAASALPGGLSRALFQARARVLAGDFGGQSVKPYLSALLIADEIAGARQLFTGCENVVLVAGDPQMGVYRQALESAGLDVQIAEPQKAFLAGLGMLAGIGGA